MSEHARARILWTAKAIANRLGCSPDFVRDVIAREPDSPVKALGRRLYAFEDELISWLRHRGPLKPTSPH